MKKFGSFLIACLVVAQTTFAAVSPLAESVLEYEAIANAIGDPAFTVIGQNEFIVSIKRITRRINNLGEVKYSILTRSSSPSRCQRPATPASYIATLNIAQNTGIGPNIITVVSIVPKN